MPHFERLLQQRYVEVGHAYGAHLAGVDQRLHRAHGLLYRRIVVGIGPVQLIQIDVIGSQPLQAGIRLAQDRVVVPVVDDGALLVPGQSAFGRTVAEPKLPAPPVAIADALVRS